MAIYGLNFNSTHIPPELCRPFTSRMRKLECGHPHVGVERVGQFTVCPACGQRVKVVWFYLQGVGESAEEARIMQITADNGHRKVHVEGPRSNGHRDVWAIYTY